MANKSSGGLRGLGSGHTGSPVLITLGGSEGLCRLLFPKGQRNRWRRAGEREQQSSSSCNTGWRSIRFVGEHLGGVRDRGTPAIVGGVQSAWLTESC